MGQSGMSRSTKSAEGAEREAFGIRTASVIAYNWKDNTVDLLSDGGVQLIHVPVACPWAGTNYGDISQSQPVEATATTPGNEIHALVAFTNGLVITPIVIGFFYAEVSEMMLEGIQRITRHLGDSFTAVSLDGDIYLGFTSDGSFVAFHNGNPHPPVIHGQDYDGRADPATNEPFSFTAQLKNGSTLHIDGESGNVLLAAAKNLQLEALEQLDLYARNITLNGLQGVYPGDRAGLVVAPSTDDPLVRVGHLTTNAAYDYLLPVAARADDNLRDGWTYLGVGPASRVEMTPTGKLRTWYAPVGYVGDPIVWAEYHAPPPPYAIPPPPAKEPYTLSWCLKGNQDFSWVCGPTPVRFTDYTRVSGATGTLALTKNGSAATLPTALLPLTAVEGDVIKATITGATAKTHETLLTLWGQDDPDPALPPIGDWFLVDTSTIPPTVSDPVP